MATTNTTTTFAPWAQPYAEGFLQRAQQTADQPYQPFAGQRVAGFTPWQQQGLQAMASRAMQGSPVMGAAQQGLQAMMTQPAPGATVNPMAGQSNPYLQQTIDQAQQDVVRNWNTVQMPQFDTAMSRSGSFGNAGVGQVASQAASDLQRNLGDISSRMRFQDYSQQQQLAEQFASRNDNMLNAGRGRIMQALGLAPSMAAADYGDIDRLFAAGGAAQTQNQRMLDDAYGRFTEARDYPRSQLDIMGNALSRVGGSSTQSQLPEASTGAQALGGALTFAQLWKLLSGD